MRRFAEIQYREPAMPKCKAFFILERKAASVGAAMCQGADESTDGRGRDGRAAPVPDPSYPAHARVRQTIASTESTRASMGSSRGATTGTPYLLLSAAL